MEGILENYKVGNVMKKDEKIIEVLTEMIDSLMKTTNKEIKTVEKEFAEKLIKKGYGLNEINDILDEVFKIIGFDNEEKSYTRVFDPFEFIYFTKDAKDYLLALRDSKIISSDEFEQVLSDVTVEGFMIDIKNLKDILDSMGITREIVLN